MDNFNFWGRIIKKWHTLGDVSDEQQTTPAQVGQNFLHELATNTGTDLQNARQQAINAKYEAFQRRR